MEVVDVESASIASSCSPADSGISLGGGGASPDLITSLFKVQPTTSEMTQLAQLLNLQLRPVAQCGICSEMILVRNSEDVLAHIQLMHSDVLGQLLINTLKAPSPVVTPPTPTVIAAAPPPPPAIVSPPALVTAEVDKKNNVPMSSYFRFISADDAICALCMQLFAKTTIPELALHLLNTHPREALLASMESSGVAVADEPMKDMNENLEKASVVEDEGMDADLMEILRRQRLIAEDKPSSAVSTSAAGGATATDVTRLVQEHMMRSFAKTTETTTSQPLKSMLNVAGEPLPRVISTVWHSPTSAREKRAAGADKAEDVGGAAATGAGGCGGGAGALALVTSMQRATAANPLHGYLLNGHHHPHHQATFSTFPYGQNANGLPNGAHHIEVNAASQPQLWKPAHHQFDEIPVQQLHLGKDEEKKDPPTTKRGRPTENPCWGYFVRLDEQNVRCRLCSKIVKSACATNMTKHLERHHHEDHQHLLVQIRHYRRLKAPATSASSSPTSTANNVNSFSHSAPSSAQPTMTQPPERTFETASLPGTPIAAAQIKQEAEYKNDYDFFNAFERQQVAPENDWTQMGGRRAWGSESSFEWPSTSAANGQPTEWRNGEMNGIAEATSVPAIPHLNNNQQLNGAVQKRREKPYAKRNRKTEHPVWQFFARTNEGDARCALCTALVRSPCSSNFMRHLMRHHAQEYQRVYTSWLQKRTLHLRTNEGQQTAPNGLAPNGLVPHQQPLIVPQSLPILQTSD